MQDFMAKVRKSKQGEEVYPLFLRPRHIYTPYIHSKERQEASLNLTLNTHDYNKNEKAVGNNYH